MIDRYLAAHKTRIDAELDTLLPAADCFPDRLHQAMRYCILAGGKRLRPILAIAAAEALGGSGEQVLREACSLEMIHTYTLLHDDLPCMDDDDMRRGSPATHIVYGEAMAVLAADALQTEAFRVLTEGATRQRHPADVICRVVVMLADACGSRGVIGGQVVDIDSEGSRISPELLEYMHMHKTGKLITASVMLGALLQGGSDEQLQALEQYGQAVGLLFQITDDILDITGDTQVLGKTAGSDEARGKATYPALLGMEAARKEQQRLYEQALAALAAFGAPADRLRQLAGRIHQRNS